MAADATDCGTDSFFAAPYCDAVRAAAAEAFDTYATSQVFPVGVAVFHQGERPQSVLRVTSGLVKLVQDRSDGTRVIIALRGRGWLLGATSTIAQTASTVTAVTANRCAIQLLRAQEFSRLLSSSSTLSAAMLRIQTTEIEDLTSRCAELATGSSRSRLLTILRVMLAGSLSSQAQAGNVNEKRPVRLKVPLKDFELAQLLGVTPAHLCRLFNALEKENVIRRTKGWVEIINLHRIATEYTNV